MSKRERGSKGASSSSVPEKNASGGGRGPAPGIWQPGARIAVFVMLGLLGGADIWIFTAAKISSLPQLHVRLFPSQLGDGAPGNRVG